MTSAYAPLDDYERGYASAEELIDIALWSVGLQRALNMAEVERRRNHPFPAIGSEIFARGAWLSFRNSLSGIAESGSMNQSTESKHKDLPLPIGMAESLQEAERAWADLLDASERIKDAYRPLQRLGTPHSFSGYEIERAHWKHKPDHIRNHLQGLQKYMNDRGVKLVTRELF